MQTQIVALAENKRASSELALQKPDDTLSKEATMFQILRDGSNQPYITVENVRITVSTRTGDKDWAGTSRYLTFRAARDSQSNAIMPGPDLPIRSALDDDTLLQAAAGLLNLVAVPPA